MEPRKEESASIASAFRVQTGVTWGYRETAVFPSLVSFPGDFIIQIRYKCIMGLKPDGVHNRSIEMEVRKLNISSATSKELLSLEKVASFPKFISL